MTAFGVERAGGRDMGRAAASFALEARRRWSSAKAAEAKGRWSGLSARLGSRLTFAIGKEMFETEERRVMEGFGGSEDELVVVGI